MNPNAHLLLVCGGRDWGKKPNERDFIFATLDSIEHDFRPVRALVHGGADGVDSVAGQWARTMGVIEVCVPANWRRYGASAGPIRNASMLALAPDLVIAFPGGRGTEHMVTIAKKAGVQVCEVKASP